jgi:hypothetical protein
MRLLGKGTFRAVFFGLAASAVVGMLGSSARADFLFNPTGGGAIGAINITGLDPLPGNGLAEGAVAAIANASANGGGDVAGNQFLLKYQAALGSVIPGDQNPSGLNTTFQITFTGVVREYVQSVSGGTATFGISADQTGSFLNIYQNNAVVYNDLNGTGFTTGNLILTATPLSNSGTGGNFTNTGVIGPLDQHGSDDWAGTSTTNGFGGAVINFQVTSADSTYFINPEKVLALAFSSTQNLPFTTVDPSKAFFDGTITNVGAINGETGPDVLLQADANVNAVPEPSSLCLTALGLGSAILFARRKRAQLV